MVMVLEYFCGVIMENISAILMKNDNISVIILSYLQYASLSILSLVVKERESCGTRLPIDPYMERVTYLGY